MSSCNACKKKIKPVDKVSCSRTLCGKHYHLLCVNLTSQMDTKTWLCPMCSISKPRGDNTNTPIKSSDQAPESDQSENSVSIPESSKVQAGSSAGVSDDSCSSFDLRSEFMNMKNELPKIIGQQFKDLIEGQTQSITSQISSLESSVQFLSNQYDSLLKSLTTTSTEIKKLKEENQSLKQELNTQSARIRHLEEDSARQQQWARLQNVELVGVPEAGGENTCEVVVKVAECMGVCLQPSDIEFAHRVQPRRPSSAASARVIVARLRQRSTKDTLVAASRKRGGLFARDIGIGGGVWSLKNLSISVPRAVLSGEGQAAVLRCSYDLEGAALYSIRWYRAETEFYRYVPREMPPSMVFPLPGASVDLTQSDHQQVRIVNLNRRLSGDYQCEVSADAPLFHTDIRWAPLTVVDPPFRAPRLTVSRDNFARGDVIRANCTVDEAYPAPNITWILDDHKIAETIPDPPGELDFSERGASSQLEITVLEAEQFKVGLTYTSASLGRGYRDYGYEAELRKNVTSVRYTMVSPPSGQFTLGCVTTIFDIYARKSESVVIREDAPRPESVTGEDSSGALPSLSVLAACCACALHAL